ncbi:MAG: hypothetical protein WAK28_04265 [Trebonia sp.]
MDDRADTAMLRRSDEAFAFDERRQLGEVHQHRLLPGLPGVPG